MTTDNTTLTHRFIPFRKHDIVEMCIAENLLNGEEQAFRQLYYMLSSVFHFEFHQIIESLKDVYAAVDPDSDTRQYQNTQTLSDLNLPELLGGLLEKANYERISEADLNQAMNESSMFKIRLHVDFNDFSEVLLFCRGENMRQETITGLWGLTKKTIEFINYDRVVVYIRFSDNYVRQKHSLPFSKPGATLLKLFRNVPKADLEMLFPNTSVRMRLIDKLFIGVPAVISGGIVLSTKLGASLVLLGSLFGFWLGLSTQPVELNKAALMALLAGVVALGGYLWKQFNNFKNRKLRFMQALTQNLYFKNLDNNAGVFHRIADDAEEEECKEAILAYYFLLVSNQALSKQQLDKKIEDWFSMRWDCEINFEIDDALNKLLKLGLVKEHVTKDNMDTESNTRNHQSEFTAIAIDDAIQKLDRRWDAYFVHA